MAAGNLTFTTTGQAVLNTAYLRAETVDFGFLDIGGGQAAALNEAARILTEAERDILDKNPALQRADTTETVLAGNKSIPIPTAAAGLKIIQVKLVRPDGAIQNMVILEASPADGESAQALFGDDFRRPVPYFCYWSADRSELLLAFPISEDTDFIITFQNQPTTYTGATLGTDISRIPDQYIDTLYFKVASEFASIMGKTQKAGELDMKYLMADARLGEALLGAFWKYPRFRDEGHPGSTLDHVKQSSGRYLTRPTTSLRY